MKKTKQGLILFLLLIFAISANADTYKVKGYILDSLSNSPLKYCNVSINLISKVINTTASKSDGSFVFDNISNGEYFIKISYEGYITRTLSVKVMNEDLIISNIKLVLDEIKLETVTVSAKKPLIIHEKGETIYNIEGSVWSNYGNAINIIKQIPQINFKDISSILLKGKKVTFYLDGKSILGSPESLENTLTSLNSNDIEKIELISNPGSKYDATSMAVVNIRTTKMKMLGTIYSLNSTFGISKNYRFSNTLKITHKNGWSNTYLSIGENTLKRVLLNQNTREIFSENTNDKSSLFQDSEKDYAKRILYNLKFGGEFSLNKSSKINANFKYDDSERNRTVNTKSNYNILGLANELNLISKNRVNYTSFVTNLNYNKSIFKGLLDIDYDFISFKYKWNETANIVDKEQNSIILIPWKKSNDMSSSGIKYNRPIKNGFIEAGYLFRKSNNDTFSEYLLNDTIDSSLSSNYEYNEKINAGYINFDTKYKKLAIQGGLRYESAKIFGSEVNQQPTIDNIYSGLFPSISLQLTNSENSQLTFSHTQKITRPSFETVNRLIFFKSPYFIHRGGGNVIAAITKSYEIGYNIKNFNFGLSLTNQNNRVVKIPISDKNLVIYQTGNIDQIDFYLASMAYNKEINNFWNISLYSEAYKSNLTSKNFNLYKTGYTFSGNMRNSFSLKKGYLINLAMNYYSKDYADSYNILPQKSVDIDISKSFFNKDLNVNLSLSDIFNSFFLKYQYDNEKLKILDIYKEETRILRINLTYRIGNKNVKFSERKSLIESDIRRVN